MPSLTELRYDGFLSRAAAEQYARLEGLKFYRVVRELYSFTLYWSI